MTHVARYNLLEKQIKWIQTELKKGEYKAAGLSVDMCIGNWDNDPHPANNISISLGVYSGIEQELLELVLKGLIETRKYVLKDIQEEFNSLKEFIENNQTNQTNQSS